MNSRIMRAIVFFDLPTGSKTERKHAAKFRKFLLTEGFFMMQESVYSKLLLNAAAYKAVLNNMKKNKPPSGLIQLLTVTENQYNSMEFILGKPQSETIDSSDRLVFL